MALGPARGVSFALAFAGGGLVAACGPSFQAIYEGNARFEHCYALEEAPNASMSARATCWREWSDHYTYGQTRDRVHYAIARYVALSQAPQVPTDEALMMAAPGVTPRVTTITAPAPTNADAPPPKVLEADGGGTTPAVGRVPAAAVALPPGPPPPPTVDAGPPLPLPLPAADCATRCSDLFRACEEPCAAKRQARSVCASCEPGFKRCMRACYD